MPRTIEGIVESHRAASELRRQGKPIWKYEVKVKDLLGDDDSNERAVEIAKELAKRMRTALPDKLLNVQDDDYDDEITSIIEDLETFNLEMSTDICSIFNERLDEIYDWADANRVWIG